MGAATALLLGRTLLNRWVQNTLKNHPHFSEVYTAMGKDTFKLAVMLRLSPVPSWVNNYGLALTPISFKYVRDLQFLALRPLNRHLKRCSARNMN